MNNIHDYKVGATYPLTYPYINDGGVLEVSKDGEYLLTISMNEMTLSEENLIRKGKIEFRTFEEDAGIILLIKFG